MGGIGVFTASAALLIVWKVNNGSVNPGYRVRIKYSPNLLAKVKLISLQSDGKAPVLFLRGGL